MADNAAQSIKDLDEYIKKADKSLQTLVQRYERLSKAMDSKDESKISKNLGLIEKGSGTLVRKLNTLENKLKELYKTAGNTAEFRRLSLAIKELTSAGGRFPSILEKMEGGEFGTKEMRELLRGISSADSALRRFRNAQKEVNKGFSDMIPTLQRVGATLGVAFSVRGLAQFGRKLIETRGEFELQQVALRSILQNKQLADEIWDKTLRAALQSPFTAMQLTTYTKQLAAYRIETEKLFDTTKRLADVSAGLGVDMQRLILAYGQVKAANYLRASEIRQFTEAGVNILGELSAYLTEVKGQAVSTAQVMEMVTKRMIRFEDVEEIFKRMTDAGGIFYNMQYIQSQTVKGQIAKLHDAYDQMLNSIGKANEGVLKGMVSILNSIVQNWREWKTVLDTIAFPALAAAAIKFSKGLFAVNAATIATNKSFSLLTRSGAKLNLQLKALGATLKAHPLFLIATVLFTVSDALWNHAKAVKAVNNGYDELNGRLLETQHKLSSYEKRITENNEILKDSSKSQKEHNKAQTDNAKILGELKRDYPDVAEGMSIADKGIIAMTNSIKAYNAELRLQLQLNERAKASFSNQSAKKDAQQLDESLNEQQRKLAEFTAKAARDAERMRNNLVKGAYNEETTAAIKDIIEKLEKVSEATSVAEYEEAIKALEGAYKPKSIANNKKLKSRRAEMKDELKEDYVFFGKYLKEILELSDDFDGEMALSTDVFVDKNREKIQGMLYTIEEDGTKKIGELGYVLSQAFAKSAADLSQTEQGQKEIIDEWIRQFREKYGLDIEFGLRPKISKRKSDIETNKGYFSNMISLIKEMRAEYDKLSKSAYGFAKSEDEVRKSYKKAVEEILGKAGITPDFDFTTNEGMIAAFEQIQKWIESGALGSEFKDEWDKVVKIISQLNTEIGINVQVRNREEFAKEIEKMFSDYELTLNFESIGLPSDLAKNLFGIDTSSLDEISSYVQRFATEHAEDWNEDINKIYADALKKISDKEQEQYKKDVSNLFKRVKNSADEMKTVMAQAAADINFADMLFDKQKAQKNINTITEQIEKNIEEINRLTPADGKATGVAAQQIARLEAENKILQNRVLRLSQMYGNLSAEQYTDLVRATMEHENEQLQKISLEQLKQLPEYIEAMGRTAGWSNEKLREMLDYLQNLISVSGGNIDITEYKSIINQIDKIQAEIKQNDYPFGREGFAKVAQMLQEQSEAEAKLNELTEERNQLMIEQKLLELEEIELQARLNELKAKGLDENSEEIQEIMEDIKSNQKFKTSNLIAQKKNAAGIQTITKGNAQTMVIIDAIIHGINNLVQEIYQNLKKVEILLQDYEVDTEHGKWAEWAKGMETFAKASQDATNGWEAYKKGDIAGIVYEVINGITDIWHGINEIANQKYVDTIYEMEQELERLTADYEKLQKAIEKTWDTSSYMMNYEKMVKNLEDQRKVLQAQYAAEDARKNSDEEKMKEYQDSIRDIDETLTELKQKQIEVFGGLGEVNYRSAAQEFVDAWKSAFLETGDGLQGLQDHFDEFLNEWFVKQATMRIAGKMLQPLFEDIDRAVDQYNAGGTNVLMSELNAIREKFGIIAPQLSDALEQLAGMWGLGDGEGGLSGLATGIQGMSEEQANILEAYWNSVRMYTASIDMNVARIVDILGAGTGDRTNPQLQQLEIIARNTTAINSLFDSVVTGAHTKGGKGIKVFMN